jgi:saccharopepsin
MVIVPPLLLALLPFVAASRLHKLKLHKVSPTNLLAANNPELEAAYLAEKYGAPSQMQMPLLGLGGAGRVERPSMDGNEPLFWTQEELKGGHSVPLTSLLHILGSISQPL